jgi:hypothetical protein
VNLSALTIQQLRYVVAVDSYRSFGDAARASACRNRRSGRRPREAVIRPNAQA